MIDYKRDLNPEQLEAVLANEGPILVIAGAGSGKTRTLTYRVAYLIESGVRPESILLATFTNKAAREMIARVEALTGFNVSRLWAGTFHHIANLILRREGRVLGLPSNYVIIDEEDADQTINTLISELRIDSSRFEEFPKGSVIRGMISFSINSGHPLEEVISKRYPFFLHFADALVELSVRYHARKREANVLDFDDLLRFCLELLEGYPQILQLYSGRFRHVLVDEYQDTSVIQARIIDLLGSRHRNLMVVGDDSQSIYSFRGANFAHILDFSDRYPDVRIFTLETNYRSTPEILHLANCSISNNEKQFYKKLKAVRGAGMKPVLVSVKNISQQAEFVAQRIIELVREGVRLRDIAVLYRAHYHSMELQMEMTARGLPFEIRSGIRFFEQAHIKDVSSFLRIIANPRDETAWKRALMMHDRIGRVTAGNLWKYISALPDPLASLRSGDIFKKVPKPAEPGMRKFRDILLSLDDPCLQGYPSKMIDSVLEHGYREYLRSRYEDFQSREDDLNQLAGYCAKFSSLQDFLSELALLSSVTEEDVDGRGKDDDRVILSTIHQAKGLEWRVVFVICCSDGMLPLLRSLKEPGGEEEERRLFYVAVTRAKDQLYFCRPVVDYGRSTGNIFLSPSRFIEELTPSYGSREKCPYEKWSVFENLRQGQL
ncbi:MAG: ATP-dependent helicase [Syntrophales bacterium]